MTSSEPRFRSSAAMALLAGLVFGAGLVLSGMTKPAKVSGFLDVAGEWDPSLAFVMVGAIGVHLLARRALRHRAAPLLAPVFHEPVRAAVDAPLLAGASLFGVGWGLGGYCPGPALVTLGSGSMEGVLVVVAMAAGMAAHDRLRPGLQPSGAPRAESEEVARVASLEADG